MRLKEPPAQASAAKPKTLPDYRFIGFTLLGLFLLLLFCAIGLALSVRLMYYTLTIILFFVLAVGVIIASVYREAKKRS